MKKFKIIKKKYKIIYKQLRNMNMKKKDQKKEIKIYKIYQIDKN